MRSRRGAVTVTVTRSGVVDLRHGKQGPDTKHDIDGVGVDLSGGTEVVENGIRIVSDAALYCPPGADIRIGDHVRLPDGDRYRVVRKPAPWTSLYTGRTFGVVVHVKAVV